MRYFLVLLMLITIFESKAQIHIWLNDGTIIPTANYRIDTSHGYVFYLNKKNETRYFDKNTVFAIIDKQDTIIVSKPEQLSTSQAFSFLRGVNDGYKYKNKAILLSNIGIGLISGLTLPIAGFAGIYTVIPNFTSALIFASTDVKEQKLATTDSLYQKGYRLSSRKKRLIIATEGGLIGLAAGSIMVTLIKNQ
jgi:hypothetical protein